MSAAIAVDAKHAALLLMDFQTFVVDNFLPPDVAMKAVAQAAALLAAARTKGVMVIHVAVGFRPGYPEISERNKLFSFLKESGLAAPGSDSIRIHAELAPRDNEPVVVKHRVGAFAGTDLDRILRARNIETLTLAGVTTSGVVLSTLRQGFDLDYQITVAADACADNDGDVHRALIEKILPQHATVLNTEQIVVALKG
ncbi:cysteine hydrolase family protein [Acidisoma silvae]|uniref:Cysteine hydrolase n=1 Tax=Acidisoma silvae TaxID=2802396 RepID=A0A963YTC6_9PROT|nr:isochorismatase family cysteine hydrolase [Acidisoma silvae]MCB8875993.1 cysteine hydrolase [Acidisoma silvae]